MSNIQILNVKRFDKGALVGLFDIYMPTNGFEVFGLGWFRKGDAEWVNLPTKEYTDKEGQKKYAPIIRFREKSHHEEFVRQALQALKAYEVPKERQVAQEKQMNFVEEEIEEPVPF